MDKFRKDWTSLQKQQATSQIGAQATIRRETVKSDVATDMNRTLNEIGEKLKPVENCTYHGSAAVHVYTLEALDEVMYISQTHPLLDTPELLAKKGFDDLKNRVISHYGHRPPKLRSGF